MRGGAGLRGSRPCVAQTKPVAQKSPAAVPGSSDAINLTRRFSSASYLGQRRFAFRALPKGERLEGEGGRRGGRGGEER